jgi:hypothetical protein
MRRGSLRSRCEETDLGHGHHDVVAQVQTGVAGGMIGEGEMEMHAGSMWMSGQYYLKFTVVEYQASKILALLCN